MKKILSYILLITCLAACTPKAEKGVFTVHGNLKNTIDQKIYLEQLYFSDKSPEVLDTAEIKAGKFEISTKSTEEGLYRLRLEKQEVGYVFINDKSSINFIADVNDVSLKGPDFGTPANNAFKKFLSDINDKQNALTSLSTEIDSLKKGKNNDSIVAAKVILLNANSTAFKQFIVKSIDTVVDPVVAMFALGYTRGIDPSELKTIVPNLAKRFPGHVGIAGIIASYNNMIVQKNSPPKAPEAAPVGKIGIGSMAPELNMADTAGKPFLLSSLRGKYVLIDFWASWCAPCRGENPNVVANYNKYKNKNFTILGVSLDEDKKAWTKAIVKDKLAWKHVSDLKGWASAATALYGFDAIPYNVLIDPTGKIIATSLREGDLGSKLGEVLR